MPALTITIRIDEQILAEIDRWIAAGDFPDRSSVIHQAVVALRGQRIRRQSLLNELAKLDPAEERGLADERMTAETVWPA